MSTGRNPLLNDLHTYIPYDNAMINILIRKQHHNHFIMVIHHTNFQAKFIPY